MKNREYILVSFIKINLLDAYITYDSSIIQLVRRHLILRRGKYIEITNIGSVILYV